MITLTLTQSQCGPAPPDPLSARPPGPPPPQPKGGVVIALTRPLPYTTRLSPAPYRPGPSAPPNLKEGTWSPYVTLTLYGPALSGLAEDPGSIPGRGVLRHFLGEVRGWRLRSVQA